MRGQRGQGSVEYVGLLLMVSLVLAGVLAARRPEPPAPRWLAAKMCSAWKGAACRGAVEEGSRTPATSFPDASGSPGGALDGVTPVALRVVGAGAPDSDRDGLADALESELGLDPLSADADRDGRGDRLEIARGANPLARRGGSEVAGVLFGSGRHGLSRAAPARVAHAFERTAPGAGAKLARRYPEVVGGLDGAPAGLRYEANRLLMLRARERLRMEVSQLDRRLAEGDRGAPPGWRGPLDRRLILLRRARLAARAGRFDAWATDGRRRFLLFDARGDGRVAEVVGDLERAPHVAVMVPGTGSDIDNFERHLAPRARELRAASRRYARTDVAVVAWLGYDPPDTIPGAAFGGRARTGGRSLARFVAGLDGPDRRHRTVIGHSYGSVTTGNAAARNRLRADDVVFTGSPGTGGFRHDISALGAQSRFWAGEAPRDLVAWAPVHGEAPGDPGFGARRFDASGEERPFHHIVHNHQSYYRRGSASLRNLARIAGGLAGEVTRPPSRRWRESVEASR